MNDDKADFYFLDTNCVLYFLQGQSHLASLITGNRVASNFIIEVELLGWKNITEKDRKLIKSYLNSTYFFDYSSNIKELVIRLRQKYGLKLTNAFVAATAIQYDLVLISADKGFSKIKDLHSSCLYHFQNKI